MSLRSVSRISWKIRLVVEILTTYVRVRWEFRRKDLPETIEALRTGRRALAGTSQDPREDFRLGLRLGDAVGRTLRPLPFDSRCLVRSLVLTRLLERRGISSQVVIGVRPEPTFAAHAWVEREGVPLLPSQEPEYQRLVVL